MDSVDVEVGEETLRATTSQLWIFAVWFRGFRRFNFDVYACVCISIIFETSSTVALVASLDVLTVTDATYVRLLQTLVDVGTHITEKSETIGACALESTNGVDTRLDGTAIMFASRTFVDINTLCLVSIDGVTLRTYTFVTTSFVHAFAWTFRCAISALVLVFALLTVHGEFISIVAHASETGRSLHAFTILADAHHEITRVRRHWGNGLAQLVPERGVGSRTRGAVLAPRIRVDRATTLRLCHLGHLADGGDLAVAVDDVGEAHLHSFVETMFFVVALHEGGDTITSEGSLYVLTLATWFAKLVRTRLGTFVNIVTDSASVSSESVWAETFVTTDEILTDEATSWFTVEKRIAFVDIVAMNAVGSNLEASRTCALV
jgi:hypothetical protein